MLTWSHSEDCDVYTAFYLPNTYYHEEVSLESDDIQTMKNLGYLAYSDGNSVQGIRVDVLNYTKGSYKKFVKNLQKVEEDLFCIYIEVRTKTY